MNSSSRQRSSSQPLAWVIVWIAVILIGWWLRIYQTDRTAFRGDEAFTVQNWVLHPIADTLTSSTIVVDPHPPLAYTLFWLWGQLTGSSEFSLRLLPALFNLIGIAAIGYIGRVLFSSRTGWLLALIWALHAYLIWHSQDARNYAIWSGLSVTAIAALVKALRHNRSIDWMLYTLFAALTAYIYYLEILILAALNVAVLITYFRDHARLKRWLLSQSAVAVSLLPWYLILATKLQSGLGYGGTAGGFSADQLITWFVPSLLFGETSSVSQPWTFVIAVIVLALLIHLLYRNWRIGILCAALFIIPMIGLAAISTRLNVFTPRYIMGSIPAYLILLGSLLHSRKWHTAPAYLLLIGWIAVNSISLQNAFTNQKAPDWRQIARFLQQNTITGDLVIQTGVDAAFGYYFAAVDVPAQEVALPASAAQPVSEIIAFLQTAQQDYASLWITGKTIAGWSNNGVVESWAQQNLQLVRELFIDGVPIRQFKLYTPNLTEYGSPRVTFGATVALLGAAVQPISIDQQLVLWTYWQPLQPSNNSLKLFLHLTGDTNAAGSTLWQQDDHFPLAGLVDSRTWQPPSVIRDVSRVALHELPAGSYTLQIGWYDPVTLARLQTETGADSFLLGTLTINEKKEAVFNPPPD